MQTVTRNRTTLSAALHCGFTTAGQARPRWPVAPGFVVKEHMAVSLGRAWGYWARGTAPAQAVAGNDNFPWGGARCLTTRRMPIGFLAGGVFAAVVGFHNCCPRQWNALDFLITFASWQK